jgi:hypothetical protein
MGSFLDSSLASLILSPTRPISAYRGGLKAAHAGPANPSNRCQNRCRPHVTVHGKVQPSGPWEKIHMRIRRCCALCLCTRMTCKVRGLRICWKVELALGNSCFCLTRFRCTRWKSRRDPINKCVQGPRMSLFPKDIYTIALSPEEKPLLLLFLHSPFDPFQPIIIIICRPLSID